MELVGSEFMDRVKYYKESWFPTRSLVYEAIEKRYDVSFSFHKFCHLLDDFFSFSMLYSSDALAEKICVSFFFDEQTISKVESSPKTSSVINLLN